MADQDDDLENDVDYSDAAGDLDVAANEAMPVGASGMKMNDLPPASSAPGSSMNPLVRDYLENKQKLADAQQQSSRNEMITNLTRANAYLTAGLAHSDKAVNEAPFNAMAASDQRPVQDVLNAQKSEQTDIQNQQQMLGLAKDKDDNDPTSSSSRARQQMIKRLYPGKFDDSTLDTMSAAQIGDSVLKPLELDEKIKEHADEMKSKAADRASSAQDRTAAKATADQDKAYTQMRKDLETFRGNSAVQQAAEKVQNADTALAIVKGKDPNSLTTQDLSLLADEMGKIASGGVPSDHGTKALMPNNLQQKFAEMKNFLLSKPTDAQAGEYIRHNMEYLEAMKSVAEQTLRAHRMNLAKGYKSRVSPSQFNEALSDYHLNESDGSAQNDSASNGDHAQRAADILAKRQSARAGNVANVPNFTSPPAAQPSPLLPPNQPQNFANGGMVQPRLPHIPAPPKIVAPAMDKRMTRPVRLACGGEVHSYDNGGQIPGQPAVPFNSPQNDVVDAKLTPREIVLPLSVTQSKDPALAAYLFVKQEMAKNHG